jgi:hypothetical protein
MSTTHQVGAERLDQILKNNNIDRSQVCLVHWALRQEVWDWCEQSSISISFLGSLYARYDIWEIIKEDQMMWFRLKWE